MSGPVRTAGFTIIEMIVSLAIFAIVATVSVGALLMLVGTNERLQGEQTVMANLSFALDSMAREMRTGYNYYCWISEANTTGTDRIFSSASNLDTLVPFTQRRDCANGIKYNAAADNYGGVAFVEGGDSITGTANRILYYYDKPQNTIYRRVGAGAPQPIISSEITIEDFDLFVTGSSVANDRQPTITIYIRASEAGPGTNKKSFDLETTITQRTLDV